MTSGTCAVYDWIPGVTLPTIPHLPGPEPVRAPTQPGERGEELLVAVWRFPAPVTEASAFRGVLWDARIESLSIRARHLGGNQITISVPTTGPSMRILGDPQPGEKDQQGRQLYHLRNANKIELLVGSTVDGLIRWRFICRDQVAIHDGRVEISAGGIIGGLTADRVIGAPTRRNLIETNASFDQGTLAGWRLGGDAVAGIEAGGVDGVDVAWVTGTPGLAWIERRVIQSLGPHPWGRQRIAGSAYVKLPTGIDIDDYELVTIAVRDMVADKFIWPDPNRADLEAGVVTSDMARGSWVNEPVVGVGYLSTPPYIDEVWIRLHATSRTERTYFDGARIFLRENASTETSKDLVRHPAKLFNHAQLGRSKSDWGVGVREGAELGISEIGTWWHEDGQTLDEALEALAGRGLDMWDEAGPGRVVAVAPRQGSVRTDIRVNPWDVLGQISWTIDPGAQRNAIRAVSGAGSIWGGADVGAIDPKLVDSKGYAKAGAQIIDVVLSGPAGMTPTQLKQWARQQLAGLSSLQCSVALLLPWDLGMRLSVGDSLKVPLRSGRAVHIDWMRITEWVPERSRRFIAVTLGTDPDLGGT